MRSRLEGREGESRESSCVLWRVNEVNELLNSFSIRTQWLMNAIPNQGTVNLERIVEAGSFSSGLAGFALLSRKTILQKHKGRLALTEILTM